MHSSSLVTFAIVTSFVRFAFAAQSYQPAGANKGNWQLLGCANDLYPNARALNAAYTEQPTGAATTIGRCIQYCDSQGAYLAGIEDGYQCFCGPTLDNGSTIKVNGQQLSNSNNGGCTTACRGNADQNCGGPNALLVFQSTTHRAPTVASLQGQTYQGCFADDQNNRRLPFVYQGNSNPSMTPLACANGCASHGYDLSGTEYRYQCFCGSSSSVSLGTPLSSQRCEQTCTGDATSICGGPGALTVYKRNSAPPPTSSGTPKQSVTATSNGQTVTFAYQGCYADSSARNLKGPNFSDPQMTEEKCANLCFSAAGGQTYAGLEYSTECWCGKALTTTTKASNCNMACAGDASETCGGGYALTLYKLNGA